MMGELAHGGLYSIESKQCPELCAGKQSVRSCVISLTPLEGLVPNEQ
jgi:hypothetical protein